MFGLSGAAGKHPCLRCICTSDDIQLCKSMRSGDCEERSLETLGRDLSIFQEKFNSNLKKAMLANM